MEKVAQAQNDFLSLGFREEILATVEPDLLLIGDLLGVCHRYLVALASDFSNPCLDVKPLHRLNSQEKAKDLFQGLLRGNSQVLVPEEEARRHGGHLLNDEAVVLPNVIHLLRYHLLPLSGIVSKWLIYLSRVDEEGGKEVHERDDCVEGVSDADQVLVAKLDQVAWKLERPVAFLDPDGSVDDFLAHEPIELLVERLLEAYLASRGNPRNLLEVGPEEALSHPGIAVVDDAAAQGLGGLDGVLVQEFAVALKHPAVALQQVRV